MDPMHVTNVPDLNVKRVLALFRYGKGLKKIPKKKVEYYIEDPSVLSKRIYIPLPQQQDKTNVNQLK